MTVTEIINEILKQEGGYVNHPNDKGGPTNWGITQATLSSWLKRPATIEDVKGLNKETAKEIYLIRYYHGPRIDTLPTELQPQLTDMAVNHGPRKAIQLLQETLNLAGFECSSDGVLGPATRATCATAYQSMGSYLINALSERREQFYNSIVANNPGQGVFLKGWLKRAQSFRIDT